MAWTHYGDDIGSPMAFIYCYVKKMNPLFKLLLFEISAVHSPMQY